MRRIAQLLLVKPSEGKTVSFFILFFSLLGAGLAVGKGSADALFLKRYGVEYFPYVYMVLSVALAVSSTVYAAYVDRISSERFFRMIFVIMVAILVATTLFIQLFDSELIFPVYYMIYAIASELLLVHCAMYIGQNFTTLQSKRLTSLIFAGYQVGMVAGGLILITAVPLIGLNNAPLIWALLLVAASFMLMIRHRSRPSPYYFSAAKSSRSRLAVAIGEISEGVDYVRRSSLLRNASFALFFVVITFYMLSFTAHSIYTEVFDDEEKLAAFFGILVIVTNASAMSIQLLLSNRIIHRIGVRRSNYIYPATTLLSFLLLFFTPSFYSALFASFNRETVMPAMYTPTRQMFFNVLPERIKGRARAISVALVMPVALFVCGGMILLLKRYDGIGPVALAGIACAILLLFYSFRMGKDYIVTLIASMREKLYLPRDRDIIYRDAGDDVISMMQQGLENEDADVSLSYARALLRSYPNESLPMILERVRTLDIRSADRMLQLIRLPAPAYVTALEELSARADGHLQATIFDIVIAVDERRRDEKVALALRSDNPRLQVCALHAVFAYELEPYRQDALALWKTLLGTCANSQMATLRLMPFLAQLAADEKRTMTDMYMSVIPALLDDESARRIAVLRQLRAFDGYFSDEICDRVRVYLGADDPALRMAATGLLDKVCSGEVMEQLLWRALSDGHAKVRKAAVEVIMQSAENDIDQLYSMLLDNRKGTPRAHQALLEQVIVNGASNVMLEELVHIKARYAGTLLCAIDRLGEPDNEASELLLVAMRERFNQVNNLILMCIEPMISSASIAVIRAGLKTNDDYHVANAIEAMENMTSHRVIELVSFLLRGDCRKIVSAGIGKEFDDDNDVLHWCSCAGDWWLRQCCENLMNDDKRRGAYA